MNIKNRQINYEHRKLIIEHTQFLSLMGGKVNISPVNLLVNYSKLFVINLPTLEPLLRD